MARQDAEAWSLAVVNRIKSKINAKIDAINTEMGDDIVLPHVQDEAYSFQDFGQSMPNYSPMVFFNIAVSAGETVGRESSETLRAVVELTTSDLGLAPSEKVLSLILRYRRVLREVILDDWESSRVQLVDLPVNGLVAVEGCSYSIPVAFELTFV